MRITEAVRVLQGEFPQHSKSKLTACLKIEMRQVEAKTAGDVDVVTEALTAARKVIRSGALMAATRMQHQDATANETMTRVGKSDQWKAANPIGYMATKGRGPSAEQIKLDEARKQVAAGRKRMQKIREDS